ncbi:hypothetical protein PPYR_08109 [Photinus pyralis]|uniref:Uncharacterized protein n=2 Tax=Photinus pyralis TaxID=7054 RepID=A0A5N4AIC9_PHOPY|nr:hypothetical protein PPYR_08109 [Photinus pyralis]
MKICILAFAFLYSGFAFKFHVTPEVAKIWDDFIDPFREECRAEAGLDEEVAKWALLKMDFPENDAFMRFCGCLWSRLGLYNMDTNEINVDTVVEKLHGFTMENAVECNDRYKNASKNEKAFLVGTCVIRKMSL